MYYGFCNNSDEHKREGEQDFNRYGRYGYDMEKYHDHFNDCNKAYSDGFDEAREKEDRRREEMEQQERQERMHEQQRREAREMREAEEEAYWASQYEQPQPEQQYPETDDLPF